MFKTINHIKYN